MTEEKKQVLRSWISIDVPSTIDVSEPFDTEEYIKRTASYLTDLFGGASITIYTGFWKSENGDHIVETITEVKSYCNRSQLKTHIDCICDFAMQIGIELRQEAISVKVNGQMIILKCNNINNLNDSTKKDV